MRGAEGINPKSELVKKNTDYCMWPFAKCFKTSIVWNILRPFFDSAKREHQSHTPGLCSVSPLAYYLCSSAELQVSFMYAAFIESLCFCLLFCFVLKAVAFEFPIFAVGALPTALYIKLYFVKTVVLKHRLPGKHHKGVLKPRLLGLGPERLSQKAWGMAWEFAFVTASQVILMLVVQDPHCENHYSKTS